LAALVNVGTREKVAANVAKKAGDNVVDDVERLRVLNSGVEVALMLDLESTKSEGAVAAGDCHAHGEAAIVESTALNVSFFEARDWVESVEVKV
jgi:hypothetical protein